MCGSILSTYYIGGLLFLRGKLCVPYYRIINLLLCRNWLFYFYIRGKGVPGQLPLVIFTLSIAISPVNEAPTIPSNVTYKRWTHFSGCLPNILINQIGHKIYFILLTITLWALNTFFHSFWEVSLSRQEFLLSKNYTILAFFYRLKTLQTWCKAKHYQ